MSVYFRILLLPFLLLSFVAGAKDYFKNKPHFIEENLKQTKYNIDTSAGAVILYEKSEYDISDKGGYYINRKVRRIIKILNKSGIQHANASIATYHSKNHFSTIKKISGTTYNLSDGKITEQYLDADNQSQATYTHSYEKKMSMPGAQVGSIIDYTFETEEDLTRELAEWDIQSSIPKLYSEFEVFIPKDFELASLEQALPKFEKASVKTDESSLPDAYTYDDAAMDGGINRHWIRKNIPAFENEPMVSNVGNYTEELQLFINAQFVNGAKIEQNNTWDRVNSFLFKSPDFYKAIYKNNDTVVSKVKPLIWRDTSALVKAEKIFSYVRDTITANDDETIWVKKYPGKVLATKTGNVTEVNMLLIAMLKEADIECDPVILSTKQNGRTTNAFPDLASFNYTVCRATIAGKQYYLDASGKYNAFGILPAECYNGYARLVNKEGEEVILYPDDAKEKSFIKIESKGNAANNYVLSIGYYFGEYTARDLRGKWNADTTKIRKYVIDLLKSFPLNMHLISYDVKNLKVTDDHLSLDIDARVDWPADEKMIYFSPYFLKCFDDNPFTNPARKYPVELPYAFNFTYFLKLQLPDGYKIEDNIQPLNLKFPGSAQFQDALAYDAANNILTVNANLNIVKTRYKVEEYPFLKDFFDKTIAQQQKNVVIKK